MRFRKKPIVIEAMQLNVKNCEAIADWCGYKGMLIDYLSPKDNFMYIDTLEGRMKANFGDWIIKGVKGEFYPCRNDIFEATYEAVTYGKTMSEFDRGFKDGHEVGFTRGLKEKYVEGSE